MSNSTGCVVMRKRVTSSIFNAMYASIISLLNTPPTGQELAVLVQVVQRLVERRAHGRDLCILFGRQVVQVLVGGFARVDLVLHAIQAGHHQRGEGQVRVGGRIREARLDAATLRVAHVRDADRGRTVAGRVGQLDRGFEAGDQALVRVGARVGDGVQRAGVLDDAADVVQRELGQAGVLVAGEQVLPSFHTDWCTCMPEPLSPTMGLGMKVAVLP